MIFREHKMNLIKKIFLAGLIFLTACVLDLSWSEPAQVKGQQALIGRIRLKSSPPAN